jgi:glycerate dehydrogenase
MKSIFLDYATVSIGDLDPKSLLTAAPGMELRESTKQEEISKFIENHEIVLLNKLQMTREIIFEAKRLRLIALAATGTNNIDLEAAKERGVAVCNIRDYCSTSVVQHVLGAMLSLTHRLPTYSREAIDGTWAKGPHFTLLNHPIRELHGRTLGIVGWGVLGQAVARACESALGMQVRIAQREHSPREATRVPLDELLATADVISLHCPLNDQTRNLLDARRLSLMKPDALLINTARGALVDPAALAQALRAGRLGGAAIDVLSQEPPVDGNPLLDSTLPNLIVTPHIAWAAIEARQRCLDEMAANIRDWRDGGRRGRVV